MNLVCGELPQNCGSTQSIHAPFDGKDRAAADKKAQDDKQGVPDWSPILEDMIIRCKGAGASVRLAALKCYWSAMSPSKMTERTYKKGEKLL